MRLKIKMHQMDMMLLQIAITEIQEQQAMEHQIIVIHKIQTTITVIERFYQKIIIHKHKILIIGIIMTCI